ncbi:glycosyltransferase family A protein [Dyadobacter sp. CY347]|uniref:glycosyltransferase family 2 protein n=1 Tax=Dyadobacter sp. CY347 TaxID=2909336 RepID=UPI001F3B986C|nr:glycosyltransferase family A protein [Dyadobacter sp. CY347]MCF2489192.1 glycosyltransferase family 2 protein [Dyadobacter sp. CY347]
MISKTQSPEPQHADVTFVSNSIGRHFSSCKVCVIVPVRNEASHLHQTLEALRNQTDGSGQPLPRGTYEVIVLVNNSSDDSFQIVTRYAQAFPAFGLSAGNIALPKDQAHIGTVRRLLMDEAYKRLTLSGSDDGIIASTDGDTIVDSQWVFQIMAEIAKGNDAVGGRILTHKNEQIARLYHLRDVTYRCLLTHAECLVDPQVHNPYPRHFQYFAANMAVTCKMYAQAGKLPILPFLEDVAFYKALLNQDARIRNSFHVKVYTSTRTDGRVEIGFSEQLRKWQQDEEKAETQMVEDVTLLISTFRLRNMLRRCWSKYQQTKRIDANELDHITSHLQMDTDRLESALVNSTYFGPLWSMLHSYYKETNGAMALQPIDQAIAQLRAFINKPDVTVFQKSPNGNSLLGGYARV